MGLFGTVIRFWTDFGVNIVKCSRTNICQSKISTACRTSKMKRENFNLLQAMKCMNRKMYNYKENPFCAPSSSSSSANVYDPPKTGISPTQHQGEDMGKRLRKVMSNVPQAVVVVTTAKYDKENQRWIKRGITCSSFISVSMAPPIISIAVQRPSRMHDLLLQTEKFAVHVLAKEQVGYGVHFAKPVQDGVDQFEHIPHEQDTDGMPIIQNTRAVLQCGYHSVNTIGDHHVWFGEVLQAHNCEVAQEPLLYYLRSFRSIGDEMFMQAFEKATLPFEDWTHEAHIRMAWNYIREYGKQDATSHIKNGILKFNEQNKNKINRGYHETVTLFYLHVIADAVQKCDLEDLSFEEFIEKNGYLTDKNLLFNYYSLDKINTKQAAQEFVSPDKQPLP